MHPEQEDNRKVQALRTSCAEHKVPVVVLRKREIENYLPINTLVGFRDRGGYRRVYEAFVKLSQNQRDFFDMKKGFRGKKGDPPGKSVVQTEQQPLFSVDALPAGIVIDDMSSGFGEDVWRLFLVDAKALPGISFVDRVNEAITRAAIESLYSDSPSDVVEIDSMLDQIERML